jgi:uncharacterized delta-60 repeat protein
MENTAIYPQYAGQLDPEFAQLPESPGWVDLLRALGWTMDRDLFFSSVVPTPDGYLYACGYFAETVSHPVEYFIVRLREDGQRDVSFGNDGHIRGTFPINFKMIIPTRLVIQSDGKILMQVLGYAGSLEAPDPVLLLARFLASGEADQGFGELGLVRQDLSAWNYHFLSPFAGDMQPLPDGRILACCNGMRSAPEGLRENAILYRVTAEGEPDLSFNALGWLDLAPEGAALHVTELVTQPDGRIVVVGKMTPQADGHARGIFARLDCEGQLDKSFGPSGTGFFEFSLTDHHLEVNSVAVRPDGSLAGVGSCVALVPDQGSKDQGFIMVLTADGVPDATFNGGELLITPIDERYAVHWRSARFQEDGKLLVAGRSLPLLVTYDSYIFLARYSREGAPDITFGQSGVGRVETPVGGFNDVPIEMCQQKDGKIVVGVNAGSFRKGTLLRYLND